MKITGKINIESLDIEMYKGILDIANETKEVVEDELIPTFIINETLNYYSDLEIYEACTTINNFFKKNNKYTLDITRAEWFSTCCCK